MQIGDRGTLAASTSTASAKPVVASATPAAAQPKDSLSRSATPINVVSFNTAGDGCKHTPENEIPLSQPFQKVVKGAPDAPIIACQETTAPLAKTLGKLSKNGNFQVICQGPTWLPSFFRASAFAQGNLVVVPKRYKIEHVKWVNFSGRLGLFMHAVGGFLFHHQPFNGIIGAIQKRGYCELSLQDKTTGKHFTVIATHLNGDPGVRATEEPQLQAGIAQAKKQGPVVTMGDFNTPSEATNRSHNASVTSFWNQLDKTGVQDVGAKDNTSGGHDIDHVLQAGFKVVGDEVYNGNKLTIPGRPDANQVSDHYAHGVSLEIPG